MKKRKLLICVYIAAVTSLSASPIETIKLGKVFPSSSEIEGFSAVEIDSWLRLELPQSLEMMPRELLRQINNRYRKHGVSEREVFRVHDNSSDFYFSVYITQKNTNLDLKASLLDPSYSDFEKRMLCWEFLEAIEAQRPMDRKQKNISAELVSTDPATVYIVYSRWSPASGERVMEEKKYIFFDEKTVTINLGYSENLSSALNEIVKYFWETLDVKDPGLNF